MTGITALCVLSIILSAVSGLPNGPPSCTLQPSHSGIQAMNVDWEEYFKVSFHPINQNQLLDARNTTGRVDSAPNGMLVVVEPKYLPNLPHQIKIKGFAVEVMKTAYDRGHDPIEFTMVHINKKLKKLNCPGGRLMLAHKSGEEKSSISFFIKHNLHYQERGLKRFRATVLESYGKFWMMKF